MFFLNVQIICEGKRFTTSVYHKPTFNGVYTHFDSFLPSIYMFGTVQTMTHSLIDVSECAHVGLNYTLNYLL